MLRKLIAGSRARSTSPHRSICPARRSATRWPPTTRPTGRRCRPTSPSRSRGSTRRAKRWASRSSPPQRYEADDVIGTLAAKAVDGRVRGRHRHRRQGLLPAGTRRHQGLQPAGRRHVVRRRGREGKVRRRAGAGRRRARADGRLDRQHQGRAGHRREGRARPDREVRHRSRSSWRTPPRFPTSAIAKGC